MSFLSIKLIAQNTQLSHIKAINYNDLLFDIWQHFEMFRSFSDAVRMAKAHGAAVGNRGSAPGFGRKSAAVKIHSGPTMSFLAQSAPGMEYVPPMLFLLVIGCAAGLVAFLLHPTPARQSRRLLAVGSILIGVALPTLTAFAFDGPMPCVFPVMALPALIGCTALLRRRKIEPRGFDVITRNDSDPTKQ